MSATTRSLSQIDIAAEEITRALQLAFRAMKPELFLAMVECRVEELFTRFPVEPQVDVNMLLIDYAIRSIQTNVNPRPQQFSLIFASEPARAIVARVIEGETQGPIRGELLAVLKDFSPEEREAAFAIP